jgi:hypothetical protein
MKEKIKKLVKRILQGKEIPGDPIDLTPGIKVSRVVDMGERLSFNEISENILRQKELLKK